MLKLKIAVIGAVLTASTLLPAVAEARATWS
jgi:hypothetical protein